MVNCLDGCKAKLARAKQHLESLKRDVDNFLKAACLLITQSHHHSEDGLTVTLKAHGQIDVDPIFSVIAGEIVHQLRSSLDHMVHALIHRAGNIPDRNSQYPICETKEEFDKQVKRGRIKGVSASAAQLIEKEQPFQNATPTDTLIFFVSKLNNWDKHNALVVSVAAAQVGEEIKLGGASAEIIRMAPPKIVKFENGSADYFWLELTKPCPEFTASSSIDLHLVIEDESGRVFPLTDLLTLLIAGIEGTIKLFEGEFA